MTVTETKLKGCLLLEPRLFNDDRGYFFESFNEEKFEAATGASGHFVQDNQSYSSQGVLRGMHYQTGPHAQAKLVRVLSGEVLDVAIDIRPGSNTFGQHVSVLLSAQNQKQLFIPRGFAHGFLVMSPNATFFYKCDNFYNKESEGGILFNDPALGIDWNFETEKLLISEKDKVQPNLENARTAW